MRTITIPFSAFRRLQAYWRHNKLWVACHVHKICAGIIKKEWVANFAQILDKANRFRAYHGYSTVMKTKLLVILIALAVFASLAASTACATLSLRAGKMGCHKSQAADPGYARVSQGSCAMLPCQVAKGRVFLLPDSASRRSENQKDAPFQLYGAGTNESSLATVFSSSTGKAVLKRPILLKPPSLFILNCSLVC
jgi:hypothetical protein